MGQGQRTLHLQREDTAADGLSRLDATVDGSKKHRKHCHSNPGKLNHKHWKNISYRKGT
jgi:hypothetical protein